MEKRVVKIQERKRKKRNEDVSLYTLRRTWHRAIVDHRHKPLTAAQTQNPRYDEYEQFVVRVGWWCLDLAGGWDWEGCREGSDK